MHIYILLELNKEESKVLAKFCQPSYDLDIYVKYESDKYIEMANSANKLFAYDFDDNPTIEYYDGSTLPNLPFYFKNYEDASVTAENGAVTVDSKGLRFMFGYSRDYNNENMPYYDSGIINYYTEMSFDKIKTEEAFLSFGGNSYLRTDMEAFALRVGVNGNFAVRFDGGLDEDLGLPVYKNTLYRIFVSYDLSEQKLNITINDQLVIKDKTLTTTSLHTRSSVRLRLIH